VCSKPASQTRQVLEPSTEFALAMSYDLYFCVSGDLPAVSREAFQAYFSSRPWYRVEESQALYENEDTGVYFTFEHSVPEAPPQGDEELRPAGVSFNVNYYRPHYFGLEAEEEVSAFVQKFDLLVDDGQAEGMGEGPYSRDGFLSGWNAGNRFGYRAYALQASKATTPVAPRATLATAELERCWKWNRARKARQEQMGQECFVPRIMFVFRRDVVQTMAVWPDASPIALPRVDVVCLARTELAPKRRFGKREPDFAVVEFAEFAPFLAPAVPVADEAPFSVLKHGGLPLELIGFITSQEPCILRPQGLSPDSVLNEELVRDAVPRA